jgi:hypothetical protein
MRSFVGDVRDGMTEREQQIQTAFAEGELYYDDEDEQDAREGNR